MVDGGGDGGWWSKPATTPDAAKALGLHLAGYTYVEIAAELGCTPDEAYDLVRQALKTMKR